MRLINSKVVGANKICKETDLKLNAQNWEEKEKYIFKDVLFWIYFILFFNLTNLK